MTLTTAGLVVIKDRKLLLAFSNNKQAFYLPGGKTDEGETPLAAFYTHITAPAFGERSGIIMEQDCFLYDLQVSPIPAAEIGALYYFDTAAYREEPQQVPGVVRIMQLLQQDNLID